MVGICLIVIFLLLEIMLYIYAPQHSTYVRVSKKYQLTPAIEHTRSFFIHYNAPLLIDEFILTQRVWPDMIDASHKKYAQDPFDRVLDGMQPMDDFTITRLADDRKQLSDLVTIFGEQTELYDVDDQWKEQLRDPYDRALLRALYCDRFGYDAFDLMFLEGYADHEGGYGDTHYLMGLVMLQENNCMNTDELRQKIDVVARRLIAVTQKDRTFTDIYAERVVTLYWAGYGKSIRYAWIAHMIDHVQSDGGYADGTHYASHPHTTGLVALALHYFIEGEEKQYLLE